jgi:rod shape-determining protein MreC
MLNVPYVGSQANIQRGDVLVTSGMGGRFPSGYPVAKIVEVVKDANEPFLGITAAPIARLDHAKEVLLIWHEPERDPPHPLEAAGVAVLGVE